MTIAYDAQSSVTENSINNSFTHTPSGTPAGVIVLIVQQINDLNPPTAVTYGGTAMTHMTGSPNIKTDPQDGWVGAYILGSSVPTGAQTVAVTGNSISRTRLVICYSVTGAADIIEQDTDVTINGNTQASPINVTLDLGGKTCFCALGAMTGASAAITAPLSGWTGDVEYEVTDTCLGYRYDTIGSSNVTAGYTTAIDNDAIMIAVAITEDAAAGASIPILQNYYRQQD